MKRVISFIKGASTLVCLFLLGLTLVWGQTPNETPKNDEKTTTVEESTLPVVLVVSPPVFEQTTRVWTEYRQSQGYDVMTLTLAPTKDDGSVDYGVQTSPVATPDEIRAKIQKVAQARPVEAILLIGDGAPTENAPYGWRDIVPAPRTPARVMTVFGSEKLFASDAFYADFDGDGVPDAPIGRIPAENAQELSKTFEKIIRYETESPVGNWTRRINIIAGPNGLDMRAIGSSPGDSFSDGVPFTGVNALVDSVVASMARKLFTDYLPQEFAVSLTQFSFKSVFCPYPPDFDDVFLERINEGSLFFVYLGHGQVFGLDRAYCAGGREYGVFEISDCQNLDVPNMAPIACFFACYTGAYDVAWRSLAEEMVLHPKGPVAVIAASRRTAPYGMCVLGSALLEAAFMENLSSSPDAETIARPRTLGEIYLSAQRASLASVTPQAETDLDEESLFDDDSGQTDKESGDRTRWKEIKPDLSKPGAQLEWINSRLEHSLAEAEKLRARNASFRKTIDRAAAILDPTGARLDEQVRDHIDEFNLFGDPLLRVKLPTHIEINVPEITYSTEELEVEGELPISTERGATVQVELLLADYRSPIRAPKRAKTFEESEEAREEYNATYRAANAFVVDAVRGKTRSNKFQTKIRVPENFSGECVVRAAAFDGSRYYIGSKRVLVRPKSTPTSH